MQRIWTFIRVCAALWIAGLLLICNFSAWYADTICTRTPYKAYAHQNTPQEIEAEIGLYIGLRGINITLIEKDCGKQLQYKSGFLYSLDLGCMYACHG